MIQTQLAGLNRLSLNSSAINSNIVFPFGLNSVRAITDVPMNHSVIAKCVSNLVTSLVSNTQRNSPAMVSQFATSILPIKNEGNAVGLDVALVKELQDAELQLVAPKDVKSQIRDILQRLRIPIVYDFVDSLVMKIESANQSANEISEEQSGHSAKICAITGLEFKKRRMRDSVHNLIEFKANQLGCIIWAIIETRYFQRLRRIKQLGFSEKTYPGATHTRFQHSLGVYHIACVLLDILREKLGDKFDEKRAEVTMVAALLHDIGHGPESHAFEGFCSEAELKGAEHETISKEIILNSEITVLLNKYREGFAEEVADMVSKDVPKDIYASIVSSQFDADRLDYLQRDQLMTGSQNSIIDLTWLFSNIEIKKTSVEVEPHKIVEIETIVFNAKAVLALQTYILALFNLYHSVYFHPVTRAAEQVFKHLMLRIHKLVQLGDTDKVGLTLNHPIMKFMQNPNQRENLINLDDEVVQGSLVNLLDSKDSIVADLASRLKDRQLPKAFDIREKVEEYFFSDKFEGLTKEKREQLIDDSLDSFKVQMQNYIKERDFNERIWFDSGSRVAYKSIGEEPGKLDKIQVLKNGKVLGIEELSKVVEVAGMYKFERVYLRREDAEILNYLNSLITTCCKEVSQNGMSSNQ